MTHHGPRPRISITKIPLLSDLDNLLLFRCSHLLLVQAVPDNALSLRDLDFWFAAMLFLESGHADRICDFLKHESQSDNDGRKCVN